MATGTATVSFGSTPASEASVTVTGQSGITTGSFAEAFMMGDSTSDNDVTDHKFAGVSFRIVCSDLVAGTGLRYTQRQRQGWQQVIFKLNGFGVKIIYYELVF